MYDYYYHLCNNLSYLREAIGQDKDVAALIIIYQLGLDNNVEKEIEDEQASLQTL